MNNLNQNQNVKPAAPIASVVSNFNFDWSFFIFFTLSVMLTATIYVLVSIYINKPLSLELVSVESAPRIHVFKLDTNKQGFLVVQSDSGGVPGIDIAVSPYIQPGKYTNFYIKIGADESDAAKDPAYYGNIRTTLGDRFYVIFYLDVNSDGKYDKSVDNVALTDIFGRKLQAIVVAGEQI